MENLPRTEESEEEEEDNSDDDDDDVGGEKDHVNSQETARKLYLVEHKLKLQDEKIKKNGG